jgi:hypothetical protein
MVGLPDDAAEGAMRPPQDLLEGKGSHHPLEEEH